MENKLGQVTLVCFVVSLVPWVVLGLSVGADLKGWKRGGEFMVD